jgi:hypothetical protein
MKSPVALFENLLDFFHIFLKRVGDRFHGLPFVVCLTKSLPFNFRPLIEDTKDILDKTLTPCFCDAAQHLGPPLLNFHAFCQSKETIFTHCSTINSLDGIPAEKVATMCKKNIGQMNGSEGTGCSIPGFGIWELRGLEAVKKKLR